MGQFINQSMPGFKPKLIDGMGRLGEALARGLVHGMVHGTVTIGRYLLGPLAPSLGNTSKAYRPEIDGLRAITVLAVIANHMGDSILPGGYLGVDMFFVISGYVVTSSLLARSESGGAALLKDFYKRGFKRLLPAPTLMVLGSALLFTLVVSPFDDSYRPSLRTAMAALFGVSNLYLLRQGTQYLSPDTLYNPWMHSWSLGVVEQFYLVWPLVLLACGFGRPGADRWRRRRLVLLSLALLVASLSFDWAITLAGQGEKAFFLMLARFWELALGSQAYVLHQGHSESRDPDELNGVVGETANPHPQPSRLLRGLVRWFHNLKAPLTLAALAGLLLLLTRPESERPWTSLAITMLTAALLVLAEPGATATQLLA